MIYYRNIIARVLIAIGVFAAPVFVLAADATSTPTVTSTSTASSTATATAEECKEKLCILGKELAAVKDDNTMPEEEKAAKELELRRQILNEIILLSYAEIDKLNSRLNALPELNDLEKEKRDAHAKTLSIYRSHYDALKETLSGDGKLNLEQTQSLAKELQTWRNEQYIPGMKKISNFILVVQQPGILKVGMERKEKIATDIQKLASGGYLNDQQAAALNDMLSKADALLEQSRTLRNDAYALIFPAPPSESESKPSKSQPSEITPDQLIKSSFEKIKDAYGIFLDISSRVKEILGL